MFCITTGWSIGSSFFRRSEWLLRGDPELTESRGDLISLHKCLLDLYDKFWELDPHIIASVIFLAVLALVIIVHFAITGEWTFNG